MAGADRLSEELLSSRSRGSGSFPELPESHNDLTSSEELRAINS